MIMCINRKHDYLQYQWVIQVVFRLLHFCCTQYCMYIYKNILKNVFFKPIDLML